MVLNSSTHDALGSLFSDNYQANFPRPRVNLKFKFFIVFLLLSIMSFGQVGNLLDSSTWTEGTGSIGVFNQFGTDANTLREIALEDLDPYGNPTLIWKALGPVSSASQSGGWNSDDITIIDNTKSYRFTVWVKKTGTLNVNGNGKTSFGMGAGFNEYGGFHGRNIIGNATVPNPHFFYGFLPELDKWYLLVGYIHGKDHISEEIQGGIYDAVTGDMVMPMLQEFKFSTNTDKIWSKYYLYGEYYPENSQFMWNPSIYRTDDLQMPTITELTAPSIAAANNTGGESLWSSDVGGINYATGNVGIGTLAHSDFELAVGGEIITEELRVLLEESWPDYVFADDYKLPTLEEIEKHIKEKGHLQHIPSAAEVEANGIELGEMSTLLLEKIEELTLHIIQLNKEVETLEEIQQN